MPATMTMSPTEVEKMASTVLSEMKGVALGSPFMAVAVDGILMGIIICQMTHWLPKLTHDARHIRLLVAAGVTAAVTGTIYTWSTWMNAFVYNFGTYARFVSVDSMGWYGLLDVCVVVPVQLVFAERAVRINGNSTVFAIITGILIAATGAMGVTFLLLTRGATVFTQTQASVIVGILWPAICTLTHIVITSAILHGLLSSRTGCKRADKLIHRLVSVSIESQLPSTIVAIVFMCTLASDHTSPFVPFIAITHPKIFLVGMLAMVNLRHEWREQGKTPSQYSSTENSRKSGAPPLSSRGTTHESAGINTPTCASPRTDPGRMSGMSHPYGSSTRVAHGIDIECGMHLQEMNPGGADGQMQLDGEISKDEVDDGDKQIIHVNPFEYRH